MATFWQRVFLDVDGSLDEEVDGDALTKIFNSMLILLFGCLLPAATLLDAKLLHMFDRHRSVIREQVQVLGPSLSPGATEVCVRLHEDEAVFNASFARFDGDPQIGGD